MALRYLESESEANSKVSSDSLEENIDLASKYKCNLPANKKKKPKRNRSAFIIFSSETRAKIRSEQREKLNSNEMMTKLATMWKNLPEDQKKKYHDIAEKEKVRYLLELNEFYQTFPFEIIQNKTKKNHVKKPCSAYAIYLKEMKKNIKTSNPELKMADILKLVGEKWKALSEEEKTLYQDKAQEEKEATKAKMNDHMLREIEDLKKAPIPQKRVQSHKRIQKALLKENAKLDSMGLDLFSGMRPKQEEPMLRKQQISNNLFPCNRSLYDFELSGLTSLFNQPVEKFNNTENFWSCLQAGEDPDLNQEASFLMNLCETQNKVAKKSSELIFDLLNFQSKQELSVTESTLNSTPTRVQGNNNLSSRAHMMNETLINCLNFEPHTEFNFDSIDNEANFDELLQYWN